MAMTASQRVMKCRKNRDHLEIRPSLELGAAIRAAAKAAGEPLAVYITKAVEMRMAAEKEQQ